MSITSAIISISPLGSQWETIDPFITCGYQEDAYPRGNNEFGPAENLTERDLGNDFSGKDGWRMYFGKTVPGFPSHPHRGFETVTIVRKGLIDHSDSMGASARFGQGDVQWLTAGRGIVHAEMFLLLDQTASNSMELFQIWLNLPSQKKMVDPHFAMLWSEKIPSLQFSDTQGLNTDVSCIAGSIGGAVPPQPPPNSFASQDDSDLAIWTIKMEAHARWTLPAAMGSRTRRKLYFFKGADVTIDGQRVNVHSAVELQAGNAAEIINGAEVSEFLVLQGRPIGEHVSQAGPFVMNTEDEIQQAFHDYRTTHFGTWPWPRRDPVHGPDPIRFARHADGRIESIAGPKRR